MSDSPEQRARESSDAQFGAAGWGVQSIDELKLSASQGVENIRPDGGVEISFSST